MGHTEIYTKIKNLIKKWNFLPATKIQTISNHKIPQQIIEENFNTLLEKNLAILEIDPPYKGYIVNLEILLQSFGSSANFFELVQNTLKQNHHIKIKSIKCDRETPSHPSKRIYSALPKILFVCNVCANLKENTLKLINEIEFPSHVVIDLLLIENGPKNHLIVDKKYNNVFVSDKTDSFNLLTTLNLKRDVFWEIIRMCNFNEIIESHASLYNYIVYVDENFSFFDKNMFLVLYNSFLDLKKEFTEALLLSYSENFSENYLKTFYTDFYSYIKNPPLSSTNPIKIQPISYSIFDSSLIKQILPLSIEFNDPSINYYYNKWEKCLSEKIVKLNLKQFNLKTYKV